MARKTSFWTQRLEQVSNTIGTRLISAEKVRKGDRFRLYKDLLPDEYLMILENERQMSFTRGKYYLKTIDNKHILRIGIYVTR